MNTRTVHIRNDTFVFGVVLGHVNVENGEAFDEVFVASVRRR